MSLDARVIQRYCSVMIPPFDRRGNVPAGIHAATWEDILGRFAQTSRRQTLTLGLKAALEALATAGCRIVYLDGSFVTAKDAPGDFDACWDPDGVDIRQLDPVFLTFDAGRQTQKAVYGGELFIADMPADERGSAFLEFFQTDRETGRRKGIVAIDPQGVR